MRANTTPYSRFIIGLTWLTSSLYCLPTQAAPISYLGELTQTNNIVTGTVSGSSWLEGDAENTDFWYFSGDQGMVISAWATRTDDFDPAFSLFSGKADSSIDESAFSNNSQKSFGNLEYLTFADDELGAVTRQRDDEGRAIWGDPGLFNYTLPETGFYTIALGGYDSGVENRNTDFDYTLFMLLPSSDSDNPSAVPLPPTAWLLLSGLYALVMRRPSNQKPNSKAPTLKHQNRVQLFLQSFKKQKEAIA